jgi:hypothetical protein
LNPAVLRVGSTIDQDDPASSQVRFDTDFPWAEGESKRSTRIETTQFVLCDRLDYSSEGFIVDFHGDGSARRFIKCSNHETSGGQQYQ